MTTRVFRAIPVIYVDKKVIVVSKPPGVISQTRRYPDETENKPESLNDIFTELSHRLRLETPPLSVHRLDKRTTGALLLARTPETAHALSQQFQKRTVTKTYLALVRGGRETFKSDKGEITAGLKIEDGRVSVSSKGSETLTGWELVGSSSIAPLSLLRLKLHTGFKHQLRVHLASVLKAPILGDELYSHSAISPKIRNVVSVPEKRLFLHASHISFFRYRSLPPRQLLVGVTAPLPQDFASLCAQLDLAPNSLEIQGNVTINGEPAPHDLSEHDWWERRRVLDSESNGLS